MSITGSKLRRPAIGAAQIDRLRLIRQLDDGLHRRISLICGPAGFGKTWLAVDWLGHHPDLAQVWLSVDARDNDAARLWGHLQKGVQDTFPVPAVHGGYLGTDDVIDDVLATLEESGEKTIIVLDDVHLIEDAAAVASLERLIAEAPRTVHLVLIGRRDPSIRLGRWRIANDVSEVRVDDLRLTLGEASRMAADTVGPSISEDILSTLIERIGGWMAGYRLALATAASRAEPELFLSRFRGNRSDVHGQLTEEVVSGVNPETWEFLVTTSLLRNLTGDLCDAVTGRSSGAAILEDLARDGLFVVRSGGDSDWYQCHELFRELCGIELRRTRANDIPEIHRRAARWCHARGYPVEAIVHATAAGEFEFAVDWLVEASRDLERSGQFRTIVTLARAIDEELDEPSLRIAALVTHALFLLGTSDLGSVDDALVRLLDLADATDESGGDEGWDWPGFPLPFDGREDLIAIFTCTLARRSGDPGAVVAFADLTPTTYGILDFSVAEGLIWLDRFTEAEPLMLRYADFRTVHATPDVATIKGLGLSAMAALGEGRLREADLYSSRALDLNRDLPGGPSVHSTYAWLARAQLKWERGDSVQALPDAGMLVDLADRQDEVATHVLSRIIRSRLRWTLGDRSGADHDLTTASVMPSGAVVTGFFGDRIRYERARQATLVGDLDAAEAALPDWRQRVRDPELRITERLLLGRLLLAVGEDATDLLESDPTRPLVSMRDRIKLGILGALSAAQRRDDQQVLAGLAGAMRLARTSGHLQRFLDERPTFGTLLDNAAARAGFDLRPPTSDDGPEVDRDPNHSAALESLDLAEPLTPRELDVLHQLPSHRSYQEIGDELGIRKSTVKFHVMAIYRKLEADGRADAVRIARRACLVPLDR
jgi:LuxR family maltose regulon positive regulatory protein